MNSELQVIRGTNATKSCFCLSILFVNLSFPTVSLATKLLNRHILAIATNNFKG